MSSVVICVLVLCHCAQSSIARCVLGDTRHSANPSMIREKYGMNPEESPVDYQNQKGETL